MAPANAFSTYQQLTEAEKNYLNEHPADTFGLRRARNEAYAETIRMFGRNGHNDESDAFRHCYWSALLVKEIGFVRALKFTTAHECSPQNIRRERDMDFHNNAIGLRIGRDVPKAWLSAHCLKALKEGQLKVLRKRPK